MANSIDVVFIARSGPIGPAGTVFGGSDWVIVTGPVTYQTVFTSPAVAVDLRLGGASISFWGVPTGGSVLVIKDLYNLQSTTPIRLTSVIPLEDPSNPGNYGLIGHMADPNGAVGRWKYSSVLSAWLLW
jgi:hypothetical protein